MIRLGAAQSSPQLPPRLERLARPNPYARRDAAHQRHKVFQHENQVDRLLPPLVRLLYARTRQRRHPVVVEVRLVEVAGDDDRRGNRVQHAEDSDSDHELLELVGLRSSADPALLFNHRADAEQRDEPGEQERRADDEIDEIRRQHEVPQMLDRRVADVANAGQRVAVDGRMDQHGYALQCRDEPGSQVEEVRNLADGFISPLQARREEPGEAENHPPDRRCHAEVVNQQEHDGARALARRRVFDDASITRDFLMADEVLC